jgi:type I restriction enzyme M protein
MLNVDTRRRIDTARDILVGKLPDPKSQVEQITIALIFKFMDDMDRESLELGGKTKFFTGEYQQYTWSKIFDPRLSGYELVNVYGEAIQKMNQNPNIPQLFRDIFKNAFLPYRDPETLKSFLKIINDFEYDHSEKLGDAFEYLLSVLGSQGEAGQFRTPRHIIDFMVEIVDPGKHESILDPACGTAGFLISSYKHILKHNSENFDPEKDPRAFELHGVRLEEITINSKKYPGDKLTSDDKERLVKNIIGYDISPDMVRLSLVNMYLHGFSNPRIFEYDTLTSEEKWNEYADVIMANPPFMSPKGGIRPHKRFSIGSSRSEVLFVDYIVEHLTPQGRAAVIVPEGIIFQTQTAHKNLRKLLIEKHYLVGVISLPAGVFNPYSGVKTSILWMDRSLARKTDKVILIRIDNDGFDLGAQRRPIKHNDLPDAFRAIQAYEQHLSTGAAFDPDRWQNIIVVQRSKIAENGDYNLTGERYKPSRTLTDRKWPMVKLGEVSELIRGITFSKKDQLDAETKTSIRVATTKAAQELGIVESDLYYVDESHVNDERKILREGDILISSANSLNLLGRTTYVTGLKYKCSFGAFMSLVRADITKANPSYVLYCLRSNKAKDFYIQVANTTTNISNLSFNDLASFQIPLPPLEFQDQIVAEISGYQKIIDGARQIVKTYKPHIDIGPSWPVVELERIADVTSSKRIFQDEYVASGIPFYRTKEIVELSQDKPISLELFIPEKKYEELKEEFGVPHKGEILISAVGTIGVSWVISDDRKFYFKDGNLLWVKNLKGINPYFLKQALDHVFSRRLNELIFGAAYKALTIIKLKQVQIPLPDFETQLRIVAQIEREWELVRANKQLIEIFEQKIKNRIAQVWGEK